MASSKLGHCSSRFREICFQLSLRRGLIALAALAVAVAAVMWFGRSKPVSVVVAEVQRGKVEATIANTRAGAVETCQRAKLSTITGGRIEVLTVKEGDRVKKGQLLMKLWNDDQQAQQALAVAQLDVAQTSRRGVHASGSCRTRSQAPD